MGQTEAVKALLAAPGIAVNQADKDGATPLNWASYRGHTEVVKALLAAPGIAVNQAHKNGKTPLSVAFNEEIRALLRAGARRAAEERARREAEERARREANRAVDGEGNTKLTLAAKDGQIGEVTRLLAAPGIAVYQANKYGETPLN